MFPWKRRNDGFEWREYVRTTILLRRGDRRRRVEDARDAALDGVKQAGGKVADAAGVGAQLAGRGVGAAGRGIGAFLEWLLTVPSLIAERLGPVVMPPVRRFLYAARYRLAPQLEFLARREIRLPLMLCAGIAGAGTVIRYLQTGWDQEVTFAALIAAAAALLVAIPALALHDGRPWFRGSRADAWLGALLARALRISRPVAARMPRGAALAGALVAAVVGMSAWFAFTSGSDGTTGTRSAGRAAISGSLAEGRGIAVSGDTLRISGTLLKLAGIEAPEREQSCTKAGAIKWRCGEVARSALDRLVRGKRVSCEIKGASDPVTATCRVEGEDVAGTLVRQGHVFAETSSPGGRYVGLQDAARAARAGLWAGTAERPSEYRAKKWEEAKRTSPEGCPIKGQVSDRGRIYVLPWSPTYDRVKVRAARGERWFCSEEEAQAAGWSARS